jgi:hypothetical protein
MNKNIRLYIFILSIILILLLGIIFWPYILDNIVMPLAMTLWMLLRISLLSIDQKYYWWALILAILFFFFYRLGQGNSDYQYDEPVEQNTTLKNIEFWQIFFKFSGDDHDQSLKNELARLLTSIYASDQRILSNYEVHEALKQRTIPLPESIYQYIFTIPQKRKANIKDFFKAIRLAPKKWVRRWTKRDLAEHYQNIDEVLAFMETSLEINYDDKPFTRRDN